MAAIKANLEAQLSDEVIKKLIEVIEETGRPIKELQVEISNVSGRVTAKLVPAEEQLQAK